MKNNLKHSIARDFGGTLFEMIIAMSIFSIAMVFIFEGLNISVGGLNRAKGISDRMNLYSQLSAVISNPDRCRASFQANANVANSDPLLIEPGTFVDPLDISVPQISLSIHRNPDDSIVDGSVKINNSLPGARFGNLEVVRMQLTETPLVGGETWAQHRVSFSNFLVYNATLTVYTKKVGGLDVLDPITLLPVGDNKPMVFPVFVQVSNTWPNPVVGCYGGFAKLWSDDSFSSAFLPAGKKVSLGILPDANPNQAFNVGKNFHVTLNTNNAPALIAGQHGNTAVGQNALKVNTRGLANTAYGVNALMDTERSTTDLSQNAEGSSTAFGAWALMGNTEGYQNTAIGFDSLSAKTSAHMNTAFGVAALKRNLVSGNNNAAFGFEALANQKLGWSNTAVGKHALFTNTSGHDNVAVGFEALNKVSSGNDNTAVGYRAGLAIDTGIGNTAIGTGALSNVTTGQANVAIGAQSGPTATVAGAAAYGSISIGYKAQASADHAIQIGEGINTVPNSLKIGGLGGAPDRLLIQTRLPTATHFALQYDGATGQISTLGSDRRLKLDIQPLQDSLDKVLNLQGIFYQAADEKADQKQFMGLIAQDVEPFFPEAVTTYIDKNQTKLVDYLSLTAVLIESMKEQDALIAQQQDEIDELTQLVCAEKENRGVCKSLTDQKGDSREN